MYSRLGDQLVLNESRRGVGCQTRHFRGWQHAGLWDGLQDEVTARSQKGYVVIRAAAGRGGEAPAVLAGRATESSRKSGSALTGSVQTVAPQMGRSGARATRRHLE